MADVGEVMLGRWGKEIGGAAQTIFLIFSMASHILTWTIAFNAMVCWRIFDSKMQRPDV